MTAQEQRYKANCSNELTDNGTEFVNKPPAANGPMTNANSALFCLVEENRVIMEGVRSMLQGASLPKNLWQNKDFERCPVEALFVHQEKQ
jgi:hypothetical protein